MFEVITDWTVNGHSGLNTVMYFAETVSPSAIRTSIHALYTNFNGLLTTAAAWNVRQTGRTLNDFTGDLKGVWTDAVAKAGAGLATGATVADATQVLLRWRTNDIVNSRFVQGHTFIPGYTASGLIGGNLASSSITTFNNAAAQFAADLNGFGIWARPFKLGQVPPAPDERQGQLCPVNLGTVWPELAVLRRRRL